MLLRIFARLSPSRPHTRTLRRARASAHLPARAPRACTLRRARAPLASAHSAMPAYARRPSALADPCEHADALYSAMVLHSPVAVGASMLRYPAACANAYARLISQHMVPGVCPSDPTVNGTPARWKRSSKPAAG